MSRTRTFKVMEPNMTGHGAELRFRGNWLLHAGFNPGARFTLTNPQPGVIQLRVNPAQVTLEDLVERADTLTR